MLKKIDHVAIVVKDLNQALEMYRKSFGLEAREIKTYEQIKATIAFIPFGDSEIHLITPMEHGSGMIGQFLAKNGEGIHHIGFQVDEIEHLMARLEHANTPCLTKEPEKVGSLKVACTNPTFTQNVLYELLEKTYGERR